MSLYKVSYNLIINNEICDTPILSSATPTVINQQRVTEIGVKGRNITFSFSITGDEPRIAPEDIKWFFMSKEIVASTKFMISNNKLTLTITNLTLDDEGNYTINATNIIGTGTSSLFLDVEGMMLLKIIIPMQCIPS